MCIQTVHLSKTDVHVTGRILQALYLLQQPLFSSCQCKEILLRFDLWVYRELASIWRVEEKKVFKKHMDDLQKEKILERCILVLLLTSEL